MSKTIRSVPELLRFMAGDGRISHDIITGDNWVYQRTFMSIVVPEGRSLDRRIFGVAVSRKLLREVRCRSHVTRRYMLSKKGKEMAEHGR